jgi:hypothetical protein
MIVGRLAVDPTLALISHVSMFLGFWINYNCGRLLHEQLAFIISDVLPHVREFKLFDLSGYGSGLRVIDGKVICYPLAQMHAPF